jgi:hypothetical protein
MYRKEPAQKIDRFQNGRFADRHFVIDASFSRLTSVSCFGNKQIQKTPHWAGLLVFLLL